MKTNKKEEYYTIGEIIAATLIAIGAATVLILAINFISNIVYFIGRQSYIEHRIELLEIENNSIKANLGDVNFKLHKLNNE